MKLLLVEDEIDLSRSLKEYFLLSNYEVDVAHDGLRAIDYTDEFSYDVIIMDVMMPKMDGITAMKLMRKKGVSTPIILLTAKSELEDKVEGLEAGADDYLTKPFHVRELSARIKALSRRKEQIINNTSFGNVSFDEIHFTMYHGDKVEHLTRKEYQLMDYFLKNNDHYTQSEKIFDDVWSSDTEAYITVVWVFISTLRKKLKNIDADIEIKAMRREGYKLERMACSEK